MFDKVNFFKLQVALFFINRFSDSRKLFTEFDTSNLYTKNTIMLPIPDDGPDVIPVIQSQKEINDGTCQINIARSRLDIFIDTDIQGMTYDYAYKEISGELKRITEVLNRNKVEVWRVGHILTHFFEKDIAAEYLKSKLLSEELLVRVGDSEFKDINLRINQVEKIKMDELELSVNKIMKIDLARVKYGTDSEKKGILLQYDINNLEDNKSERFDISRLIKFIENTKKRINQTSALEIFGGDSG